MSRKGPTLGLSAVTVEGGLINPDKLLEVAATTPNDKAAKSYQCPKGVNLRDEISRYFRIAQAEWQAYERAPIKSAQINQKFVKNILSNAFGFDSLTGFVRHNVEGHSYPIHFEGKGGRVPIIVSPPDTTETQKDAYKVARTDLGDGPDGRISKRRPDAVLQQWLNESEPALWGLAFVGDRMRLMRDNASFTRPAYIEADLGAIFRDEIFSDFTALWLLIHSSRFGDPAAPVTDCALERWREEGVKSGTAARDRLRGNVELALLALGQGFLDNNEALREKLETGRLTEQAWFEQLLRIIYRLIFLAVAEDRDLLHDPKASQSVRQLYEQGYSFDALRERSTRRQSRDPHSDAYEALKVTLDCLERGESKLGLPALGGLFDRTLTPDLAQAKIANRFFLEAIFRLSFVVEDKRRIKINWRDMATEELGSVYEGLLELVPMRSEGGRTFGFAGADEAKGNARKTSGSYYTPDSLVQTLLDSALDPVLEQAEAEGEKAILALNIIDPACGSGHFLLGAARRMATKLATLRDNENPDFQHALRDVVRSCIYGVDRNPMAVELAKVALWIEAVEPGMPLGFLDASIKCGDSLLGVFDLEVLRDGIPDEAYKPLTGDNKKTCTYFKKKNQAEATGQGELGLFGGQSSLPPPPPLNKLALSIRAMPEDTPRQIKAKSKAYDAMVKNQDMWNWRLAADIYVAAFLLPKSGEIPQVAKTAQIPTTGDLWAQLSKHDNPFPLLSAKCQDISIEAKAFHWPLEFPDIIATGGFDVVLGNPPWEKANLKYEEFFEGRDQKVVVDAKGLGMEIALNNLQARNSKLFDEYKKAQQSSDAFINFFKFGLFFKLTTNGFVNYYSSFAELMMKLCSSKGLVGAILQSGIASDKTNQGFFQYLMKSNQLVFVYDFINREKLFEIDSRFKFSLVCFGKSGNAAKTKFAFNVESPKDIEGRQYSLSYSEISLVNPNTKTCPNFTTRVDADLVIKMYSSGVVAKETGGQSIYPQLDFHRMFNATTDRKRFSTYGQDFFKLNDVILPVYESKLIWHYDHRFATFEGASPSEVKSGNATKVTVPQKENAECELIPRWNSEKGANLSFNEKYHWSYNWYLAIRMITNATNERTLVSTIIPNSSSVNSINLVTGISAVEAAILVANLNSLSTDYLTRNKLSGSNLNQWLLEQLPLIDCRDNVRREFVVSRSLKLIYSSSSLTSFASDLQFYGEPFKWKQEQRMETKGELDAFFAKAYGLSRKELVYLLDPSQSLISGGSPQTFEGLKSKEMKQFGEYMTFRLVLQAWDRFNSDGTFRKLGLMS